MSTYSNPIAHSADPESSHAAAREHDASGARDTHCAVVLGAVKAHPGLTSAELVEHVGHGIDLTECRRRLTDLKRAALIVREKPRVCSISRRKVETWRAVERRVREVRDVQTEMFR